MSMCRAVSCVVGKGCLLWPKCSLDKSVLAFTLLHFVFHGQTCLLFQVSLDLLVWKRCPIHYRGLEWKSRKSRNTWSNREIWPWSTEWSRAKVIEFCQENALFIANTTTQEKTLHMDITRWSIPKSGWLYSLQPKMEKLYIVSKNKTGSWLWLRSWTPYCQIQT